MGTNRCVVWRSSYLFVFSDAAFSAAAPAASDVAGRCDAAKVAGTVTSQVRHLPRDHGISVMSSGRLPYDLRRPNGSLDASTWALLSDLNTISFNRLWRCCRPALLYGKISRVILWHQQQRHIDIDVVHMDWYPDACQLPLLWPHLLLLLSFNLLKNTEHAYNNNVLTECKREFATQ